MATRSTVTFTDSCDSVILYVHHDGYPSVRAKQLREFCERLDKVGHRGMACEESARFVVFMFEEYQKDLLEVLDRERDPLETISVKIVKGIPCDSEFNYKVDLTASPWKVTCNGKEINLGNF